MVYEIRMFQLLKAEKKNLKLKMVVVALGRSSCNISVSKALAGKDTTKDVLTQQCLSV